MSRCSDARVPGVLNCLAARRRRYVLDCLQTAEASEVSVDALVDYIVEEETHSPAPDREAVIATLLHQHLPKLAEGLIEYDTEHGPVTTTAETEVTEPFLEFARRWEDEPEG